MLVIAALVVLFLWLVGYRRMREKGL
jgi:hypothetical protein